MSWFANIFIEDNYPNTLPAVASEHIGPASASASDATTIEWEPLWRLDWTSPTTSFSAQLSAMAQRSGAILAEWLESLPTWSGSDYTFFLLFPAAIIIVVIFCMIIALVISAVIIANVEMLNYIFGPHPSLWNLFSDESTPSNVESGQTQDDTTQDQVATEDHDTQTTYTSGNKDTQTEQSHDNKDTQTDCVTKDEDTQTDGQTHKDIVKLAQLMAELKLSVDPTEGAASAIINHFKNQQESSQQALESQIAHNERLQKMSDMQRRSFEELQQSHAALKGDLESTEMEKDMFAGLVEADQALAEQMRNSNTSWIGLFETLSNSIPEFNFVSSSVDSNAASDTLDALLKQQNEIRGHLLTLPEKLSQRDQDARRATDAELEAANRDRHTLQQQIADTEQQRVATQEDFDRKSAKARDDTAKLQSENEELDFQLAEAIQQASNADAERVAAELGREALRRQVEEGRQALAVAQEDTRNEPAKSREDIEKLRSEKEELEFKLRRDSQQASTSRDDQDKQHAEKIAQVTRDYEKEVSDLRSQLEQANYEVLGLKEKTSELNNTCRKNGQSITKLKEELASTTRQHECDVEDKQKLQEQVRAGEKALQETVIKLQADHQKALTQLTEKQRANIKLLSDSKHVPEPRPESEREHKLEKSIIIPALYDPYPRALTGLPSLLPESRSLLDVPDVRVTGVQLGAVTISHDPHRQAVDNARTGSKGAGHYTKKDKGFVSNQIDNNTKFNLGIVIDKSQPGKRTHRLDNSFKGHRRRRSIGCHEQGLHMIRDYRLPRQFRCAYNNSVTADTLLEEIPKSKKLSPLERKLAHPTLFSCQPPAGLDELEPLHLTKLTEAFFEEPSASRSLQTGTTEWLHGSVKARLTDVLTIDNLRAEHLAVSSARLDFHSYGSSRVVHPTRSTWTRHREGFPDAVVELRVDRESGKRQAASRSSQAPVDHSISEAELDVLVKIPRSRITRDAIITHPPTSIEKYYTMPNSKAQPPKAKPQSSTSVSSPAGPRTSAVPNVRMHQRGGSYVPAAAPTEPRARSSNQPTGQPTAPAHGRPQQSSFSAGSRHSHDAVPSRTHGGTAQQQSHGTQPTHPRHLGDNQPGTSDTHGQIATQAMNNASSTKKQSATSGRAMF
jgi:hypothetical protein